MGVQPFMGGGGVVWNIFLVLAEHNIKVGFT